MNPTKQARRLLKLADVVERHESHFDMSDWVHLPRGGDPDNTFSVVNVQTLLEEEVVTKVGDLLRVEKGKVGVCGMSACLGGWAVLTWPKEAQPEDSIEMAAARILGYVDEDGGTSYRLLDGLFEAGSPWKTADAAAAELRRRAAVLLAPYASV